LIVGLPPTALNDVATVVSGSWVLVNVVANDLALSPATINPATVVVSAVSGGASAVANSNGTVLFTAPVNAGTYTFNYTVKDTSAPPKTTNVATVTVTVTAVPPVAVPDYVTALPKSTTLFNILANDTVTAPTVINPATVAVSGVTGGAIAVVNPNGQISYTAPTLPGLYYFDYTVLDSSTPPVSSNSARVTVTVTAAAPVAVHDTATVVARSSVVIPVLANDTVATPVTINPATVSVNAVSGGTATVNPSGTVTYTAPILPGVYTFNYTVNSNPYTNPTDGSIAPPVSSYVATVTVTVTAVPPVAVPDTAYVLTNSTVVIPVLTNDTVTTPTTIKVSTVTVVTAPASGTATANADGTITYSAPSLPGTYTFTYTVSDTSTPAVVSNIATVTVKVILPPVANPDSANVVVSGTVIIPVLTNDTVSAPGVINVATVIVTAATGGTATANANGTVSYIAPATPGVYTFTYTVKDSSTPAVPSNSATVTVTVVAPLAITTASLIPNASLNIPTNATFAATGGFGAYQWAVTSGAPPTGLTLGVDGVLSGTPTVAGMYLFAARVTDSATPTAASATRLFSMEVVIPPVAVNDSATVVASAPITINVLANDTVTAPTVINVATVTVSAVTGGTATANADGTVSYLAPVTPGTYTFSYTVKDVRVPPVVSNSATVTVTVTAVPPVAVPDSATVIAGATVIIPVLTNDTVTVPTAINVATVIVTAATGGTATANADGTVSYIAPATPGNYTFTYTVKDSSATPVVSNSATVTVTVILPLAISTTPSTLPAYTLGSGQYTGFTFSATGGVGTYSWAQAGGTLPTGTSLSTTGVLSGTPTVAGSYLFGIQVTDSATPTAAVVAQLFSMEVIRVTATILTPANGSTFVDTNQLFTWFDSGATNYQLRAGSTPSGTDYGLVMTGAGASSTTLTGLPTGSVPVYVTLFANIGGIWSPASSMTYTSAAGAVTPAAIISPLAGSVLGDSQLFTWNNSGALQYQVRAGSTPLGTDYGLVMTGAGVTSATLTGLPTGSVPVYVTLFSNVGGIWVNSPGISYTSAPTPVVAAAISSPLAGTTLATSQAFTWNDIGATNYQLRAGSTPLGTDYGLVMAGAGAASATLTGLPTGSVPVYVTLFSKVGGIWVNSPGISYTSAPTPVVAAAISSPLAGTTLATSQAFTWNDIGATNYQLRAGSTPLGTDYGLVMAGAGAVSATLSGLPSGSVPVYVTLFTNIGGIWSAASSMTYTSASGTVTPAAFISPLAGSVIGVTQLFTWNDGGASNYQVRAGSTLLGTDYGLVMLGAGSTSATITGLPTGSVPVYVTLYSNVGAAWTPTSAISVTSAP